MGSRFWGVDALIDRMEDNATYVELVRQAQAGNQEALDRLAGYARVRLSQYIGRVTLGDELTGDVVQESIIAMLKHLSALRQPEQFWPWLYKIAVNMLNRQYRLRARFQGVPLASINDLAAGNKQHDAVAEAISNELKQSILRCMQRLKPKYRMILVMRCYDRMTYAEIAKVMGATEFGARRMFCRAKKALAKHLSKNGLGKGALVMALTVYGRMSARTEVGAAGVSITASILNPGPLASALAWMSGRVAVGLAAAGVAVGTTAPMIIRNQADRIVDLPKQVVGYAGEVDREIWYYYPPHAQNAVWLRVESRNSDKGLYCQWYQNKHGNFYRRGDTITLENFRYWSDDLSVLRLPTDSPQLARFLDKMEGRESHFTPVPPRHRGMTVFVTERQGKVQKPVVLEHDIRNEEMFRYRWPATAKTVDARDAMHQRGWTYFRVTGHLGNQVISGTGRLPFVQAAYEKYAPWLRLSLNKSLILEDSRVAARTCDSSGKTVACYAPSSFFAGLSRPWEGLHTLDTVRRDAARMSLPFETRYQPELGEAHITVEAEDVTIDHSIDMHRDVVNRISLHQQDKQLGLLNFEYLQDVRELTRPESAEPGIQSRQMARQPGPGLLWVKRLAEGTLGK